MALTGTVVSPVNADGTLPSSVYIALRISTLSTKDDSSHAPYLCVSTEDDVTWRVPLGWACALHLVPLCTCDIPYFLEYSPGLELNPVSNWTQVNLPIQIEKFSHFKSWFQASLDLNLWLWTMKLIKSQGLNQGFTVYASPLLRACTCICMLWTVLPWEICGKKLK